MPTIPQRELRNNSGELLRRAEAGEDFTVTVAGRPVAHLGPLPKQQWIRLGDLGPLWALPKDPAMLDDIAALDGDVLDPFDPDR